jgi:hypothetical protein
MNYILLIIFVNCILNQVKRRKLNYEKNNFIFTIDSAYSYIPQIGEGYFVKVTSDKNISRENI